MRCSDHACAYEYVALYCRIDGPDSVRYCIGVVSVLMERVRVVCGIGDTKLKSVRFGRGLKKHFSLQESESLRVRTNLMPADE